ncbi:MAG TPA: tRNA dihydrouridine synthase DusB [bacterium]|nr:tRNA dihydrouridine synthase DusB [bacterium]
MRRDAAKLYIDYLMPIASLKIKGRAVLAPMAGVADTAFRLLALKYGAGMVYSELISADGLVRRNDKTLELIRIREEERPFGIQIFGSDPSVMSEAAAMVSQAGPDLIDLNFGCPVRKVIQRGAGSALLKDLPLLRRIVRSVVRQADRPVTAKIRSGWSERSIVAEEAARIVEEEGGQAVTVHARPRSMKFQGEADWTVIARVKEAVSIPVIGNGDVFSPEDAGRMLDETGCDAVMIGRGAMGRPWIFEEVNAFLRNGRYRLLSAEARIDVCLAHYGLALEMLEPERAVREMRKHIGWYVKGLHGSHRLRKTVFEMDDPVQVESCLRDFQRSLKKED